MYLGSIRLWRHWRRVRRDLSMMFNPSAWMFHPEMLVGLRCLPFWMVIYLNLVICGSGSEQRGCGPIPIDFVDQWELDMPRRRYTYTCGKGDDY